MGCDFLWRTLAIEDLYKGQAARAQTRRGLKSRGFAKRGGVRTETDCLSRAGHERGGAAEAQTMLLRPADSQPWRTCERASSQLVPFLSWVHSLRSLVSSWSFQTGLSAYCERAP